jgi:hypothetical protein
MISTWPVLTGDDVLRDTWLFIDGELSVRVTRSGPLELCICGPDCARRIVTVATPEDLPLFLRLHAEALVAEGFSYEGFRVDRRSGEDRRRTERASPARRGRIRRTAAREETIN